MKRLSLLLLAALPLAAQDKTLTCENQNYRNNRSQFCEMREQTMPAAGSLAIDGRTNGGIAVKGWDGNSVLVRSQVQAWGDNDGESRALVSQVIVHATGAQVSADGPSGGRWSVSYEVFVPRQTNLNLSAHNGGLHIADVNGLIEFKTVNGGVHLARVGGDVRGHTQNGGVHVELAGTAWNGRGLEVESQNGGVHIVVPENYSAHLETSTVNGGVHSDHPGLVLGPQRNRERSISANIGAGGATIKVVTTNGGVHIGKA